MSIKHDQILYNDYIYSLKEAAKGSTEHLEKLEITQRQAIEMLQKEDPIAYNNVIFYLITVVQEVNKLMKAEDEKKC